MSNNLPLVSVLMTAYNRQQFIAEAIESVLASTYQNWELIIVDDCSKDDTVAIAKSYSKKDDRIKVYFNEKNLGDYPNRNRAAGYARGKYLVWVDSDDEMFPEALVKWVDAMEQHRAKFGILANMKIKEPVLLEPRDSIKKHFFQQPILLFGPVATVVDRNYFIEQKGFPEKYGPANDMYQNLKLAGNTNTLIFNFPLVNYRLHEGQELNNSYGYLYHNYNSLSDALEELNLPLSKVELKFLTNKNKRRFIVNVFTYLLKTRNIPKAVNAINMTSFTFFDFIKGIFHSGKYD